MRKVTNYIELEKYHDFVFAPHMLNPTPNPIPCDQYKENIKSSIIIHPYYSLLVTCRPNEFC